MKALHFKLVNRKIGDQDVARSVSAVSSVLPRNQHAALMQRDSSRQSLREKSMHTIIKLGTGGDNQSHVSSPGSIKQKLYRADDGLKSSIVSSGTAVVGFTGAVIDGNEM